MLFARIDMSMNSLRKGAYKINSTILIQHYCYDGIFWMLDNSAIPSHLI